MTVALDPTLRDLDRCGCCSGLEVSTPGIVFNRPGLSAIAYRSGTWYEFKASLIAALLASKHPELAGLTTRADDDFTIALLDAMAVASDVLTFYQERIANESYLRTATERRSLLELARLIGYELKPGVAAATLLAFTVEEAAASGRRATVDVGVKVQSIPGHEEKPQTFETVEKIEARAEWNAMKLRLTEREPLHFGSPGVWLAGTATNLKIGDALLLMAEDRSPSSTDEFWDFRRVTRVEPDDDAKRTWVGWERGLGSFQPPMDPAVDPVVFALRTRGSLFGYNAIDPRLLSAPAATNFTNRINASSRTWMFSIPESAIDLDTTYPSIRRGSWIVLAKPTYVELYHVDQAAESAKSDYGLSGKTTRLTLTTNENLQLFAGDSLPTTMVFGEPELMLQEEGPIVDPLTPLGNQLTVSTDVGDMPTGRRLIITGKDAGGNDQVELIILDRILAVAGIRAGKPYQASRLVFTTGLQRRYQAATVTVYGNVVRATHGESVTEVLGGGDGGKPFQRFTLRQPPLTFVRALGAASGAASTLTVRVNDLRWLEVPSFYQREAAERVFTTRQDDEGKTVVQFGDGEHGARLPTGQENLRAEYRKGTGISGNVRVGQLSNLLTRPLGLKAVTNPQPATGGDDPETRDAARENAPTTVLTLDRVVSLRDYEDFARAYAGIAKALATWSWDGERRGVFITVAGPEGAQVADNVTDLLLNEIRKSGDRFIPLRVSTFRPAQFTTVFKVKIDPLFDRPLVTANVVAALRDGFGFKARAFGQPVALSDVIGTIQAVPGIMAVDVDSLIRTDGVGGSGLDNPLPAALPQATSLATIDAGELLTLDSGPIVPGEMT